MICEPVYCDMNFMGGEWCSCGKFPCVHKNLIGDNEIGTSGTDEATKKSPDVNICSKCDRLGKYRPLLGANGDIMCDLCYREVFPLPSKIDDNDEDENEEEECRICLEQGFVRRCCNQYYCHSCFYKSGSCPGCQSEAHLTGVGKKSEDQNAGVLFIALSWAVSALCVMCAIVCGALAAWNELTFPTTVWGHSCYGWFSTCDLKVCTEVLEDQLANGFPSSYSSCVPASTVNSIIGDACVYDMEVYKQTGGVLGFDFCQVSPRESDIEEINDVYIFRDDFDHWDAGGNFSSSAVNLASARWGSMKNAEVSSICSVHIGEKYEQYASDSYGSTPSENGALVFSGVLQRHAETIPLDVAHGGFLKFYLKMAPISEAGDEEDCKTAYGGDVSVAYKTDSLSNWTDFGTYEVWKYRNEFFTEIIEEIPPEAFGNSTQFRWQQTAFEPSRDYWALDDVSITRSFEKAMRSTIEFAEKKENVMLEADITRCCFDSELCEHNPDLFLNNSTNFCENLPGYKNKNKKFMIGPRAYVVLALFLFLLRYLLLYTVSAFIGEDFVGQKVKPTKQVETTAVFRVWEFAPSYNSSWQIFSLANLLLPLGLCAFWLAMVFQRNESIYYWLTRRATDMDSGTSHLSQSSPNLLLVAVAILLDLCDMYELAKSVFCLCPRWIPLVKVDTNPLKGWLEVGDKNIKLSGVTEVVLCSSLFSWWMAFLCFLGGFPYATLCISVKYLWLRRIYTRHLIRGLGIIVIIRAIFGPKVFVVAALAISWLFAKTSADRERMGSSLELTGVPYIVALSSSVFFLVGLCLIGPLVEGGFNTATIAAVIVSSIPIGTLYGLTYAMLRGLPVSPHFLLTEWPKRIRYLIYGDKVHGAHRYSRYREVINGMIFRKRILMVNLDERDAYAFRNILRGKYDVE